MATQLPLLPGFVNLQDILGQRIVNDPVQEQVRTAFEQSLAYHNTVLAQAIALFSQSIDSPKLRYKSPVNAFLEALDEHGRARPLKMAGFYDVAFPVYKAGRALGLTRDARIKMTVQEANDQLSLMLDADRRWTRRQLLASLFTNTNRTFLDEEFGSLTVLPLANNDSQVYLIQEGSDVGATANHMVAQAGQVTEANFATIYTALTQKPENASEDGTVICFVNATDAATIKAFTNFVEKDDPDIDFGDNATRLIASLNASIPGRVLGKVERCWIVQWNAVPVNYILSVITTGPRALGLREPAEDELRGFQAVAERNDHPYFERQFERRLGFGAWNRVNVYILQINKGDTTYVIPSGFDASQFI